MTNMTKKNVKFQRNQFNTPVATWTEKGKKYLAGTRPGGKMSELKEKILLAWEEYADNEDIKAYMENANESRSNDKCKTCGHIEDPLMTFDEARDAIHADSDYWTTQWEFFTESLSEEMGKNIYWADNAKGVGWRGLTGSKVFEAENGQKLIDAITPKTSEFSLRIYKHSKGLKIIISHHDAPMGETHLIRPLSAKQYDKLQ